MVISLSKLIKEVAKSLIARRVKSGLTQKVLAERLGIKEQTVQRWEKCKYCCVKLETLIKVSEVLDNETAIQSFVVIRENPDSLDSDKKISVCTRIECKLSEIQKENQ